MYADQRRSSGSSNASSSNLSSDAKAESQSPSQGAPHQQIHHQQSHQSAPNTQHNRDRDRDREREHQQHQTSKSNKNSSSSQNSMTSNPKSSNKESKSEEKEVKVKQEGQKPTMETQGPPPPPTSQYYLPYMGPGPFGFDPAAHPMYRNMMVPGAPYNTAPYHLQLARFHAPEDLSSRNPNPKALDILQHHANQAAYYNPHKIHELSERALKSPTTSNVKTTVSSPNVSQQPPPNNINSTAGHGPLPNPSLPPPPPSSLPPGSSAAHPPHTAHGPTKGVNSITNNIAGNDKLLSIGGNPNDLPPGKEGTGRSPPPQRHVHTHHHTHVGVGLGYPLYSAAYGGE